jgi:predicted nuclease of predicted toxin-antitoxin system
LQLLLDAHVSGRRIAAPLREAGHDVRAVDEERGLDGWGDEELLALATAEGRVMVTFDVKDFPDIARRWAESGRAHAGLAIVVGIDHSEFGTILRALTSLFEQRSEPGRWREHTCFVSRGPDPA